MGLRPTHGKQDRPRGSIFKRVHSERRSDISEQERFKFVEALENLPKEISTPEEKTLAFLDEAGIATDLRGTPITLPHGSSSNSHGSDRATGVLVVRCRATGPSAQAKTSTSGSARET